MMVDTSEIQTFRVIIQYGVGDNEQSINDWIRMCLMHLGEVLVVASRCDLEDADNPRRVAMNIIVSHTTNISMEHFEELLSVEHPTIRFIQGNILE